MPKTVTRNYEIEEEIFKQFSIACAELNITKTEGINEALKQFAENVMRESVNKTNK